MTLRELCRPLYVDAPVAGGYVVASIDEKKASIVLTCGDRRLAVCLKPRDTSLPCFASTDSYNVVYLGKPNEPLERSAYEALYCLVSLLRRNDHGEPLEQETPSRLTRWARSMGQPNEAVLVPLRSEDPNSIYVEVETAARLQAKRLVFTGQDALAHPFGLEAARLARNLGVAQVEIETADIRLSDRTFAERVLASGVTELRLMLRSDNRADIEAISATLTTVGASFTVVTGEA